MDLVQALHQTQDRLSRKDELTESDRQVKEGVDALLGHYREGREGDVAYTEEGGTDRIDRTGGGSTEQKEQVQAALIAYWGEPSEDNAKHVTDAMDSLRQSV